MIPRNKRKSEDRILIELVEDYFDAKDIMKASQFNTFRSVAKTRFDAQL